MKHSRLFSIEQKNAALMEDVKTCDKVPEGSEDVQKLIDMLLFFDKVSFWNLLVILVNFRLWLPQNWNKNLHNYLFISFN